MTTAELEFLGELEEEFKAMPQFGYRSYPFSESFAEAEGEQPLYCPSPARLTIRGYPRYQNTVASLPAPEQVKLRQLARAVVGSFQNGCSPVRVIFITGHADRDVQRGRDFENRVSRARAHQTMRALIAFINDTAIASRIMWRARGAGSSQLAVPNPRTEIDRRLNRRVDILPISCGSLVANRRFLTTAMAGAVSNVCRIGPLPTSGCKWENNRCVSDGNRCQWPDFCEATFGICECKRRHLPPPPPPPGRCFRIPGFGCANEGCTPPYYCDESCTCVRQSGPLTA
jgi:hypothetical protein